jgi:hypothetical protein
MGNRSFTTTQMHDKWAYVYLGKSPKITFWEVSEIKSEFIFYVPLINFHILNKAQ